MEIEVFKNNNKTLYIEFTDGADDYNVPVGTTIKFSVKKSVSDSDENILIVKTITGDGGSDYSIDLTATETNLPCGVYWWDLKNVTDGVTITHPDKFVICEVVKIGNN